MVVFNLIIIGLQITVNHVARDITGLSTPVILQVVTYLAIGAIVGNIQQDPENLLGTPPPEYASVISSNDDSRIEYWENDHQLWYKLTWRQTSLFTLAANRYYLVTNAFTAMVLFKILHRKQPLLALYGTYGFHMGAILHSLHFLTFCHRVTPLYFTSLQGCIKFLVAVVFPLIGSAYPLYVMTRKQLEREQESNSTWTRHVSLCQFNTGLSIVNAISFVLHETGLFRSYQGIIPLARAGPLSFNVPFNHGSWHLDHVLFHSIYGLVGLIGWILMHHQHPKNEPSRNNTAKGGERMQQ